MLKHYSHISMALLILTIWLHLSVSPARGYPLTPRPARTRAGEGGVVRARGGRDDGVKDRQKRDLLEPKRLGVLALLAVGEGVPFITGGITKYKVRVYYAGVGGGGRRGSQFASNGSGGGRAGEGRGACVRGGACGGRGEGAGGQSGRGEGGRVGRGGSGEGGGESRPSCPSAPPSPAPVRPSPHPAGARRPG